MRSSGHRRLVDARERKLQGFQKAKLHSHIPADHVHPPFGVTGLSAARCMEAAGNVMGPKRWTTDGSGSGRRPRGFSVPFVARPPFTVRSVRSLLVRPGAPDRSVRSLRS